MAFPDDYNYKADITTDSAQVSSDESGFPYYYDLANLSGDNGFWDNVQSDGGDLRVSTNSDGTGQIPLEVVSIDTGAETGEIHFKDSTNSSSDETYYLWWDDTTGTVSQPAVTDPNGRNAVWTAYEAVYHLDETSAGTALDSTGNGYDGTYQNNLPTQTTGQVGSAQDFNGVGDYVSLPDIDVLSGEFSMTAWEKNSSTSISSREQILTKNDPGSNDEFWLYADSDDTLEFHADGNDRLDSGTDVVTNMFTHVAVTRDGADTLRLLVNGSQKANTTYTTDRTTDQPFSIGQQAGFDQGYWNGIIDEVRISTSSGFSNGWLSTEYNIQDNNTGFWTTGTSQNVSEQPGNVNVTNSSGVIQTVPTAVVDTK